MTPWKPPRGTYEIDRVFPAIGRVRIRTGTHDRRRAEQYETMLELLPLETVRLIVGRRLSLRAAYDAWTSNRVGDLPTAKTLLRLVDEMALWLEKPALPVGKSEAANRQRTAEYLLALNPDATIDDLPGLFTSLRGILEDRPTQFNRARAVGFAFLRDRFQDTALREQLVAVPALSEPPKAAHHPRTVTEARAIAATLGPKWGPAWWSMCLTGMGPKEYWLDGWRVLTDGVEIKGEKETKRRRSTARQRLVPLVGELTPAPGTRWGFTQALRKSGLGVAPYDARRSFARWLDDAGLPDYVQDALMGHGPKSMRELYKWGDIRAMLGEAKQALLKVLQASPHITHTQRKVGA